MSELEEGAGSDERLAISEKVLTTLGEKIDGLTSLSDKEIAARDVLRGVRLELVAGLHVINTNAMAQDI